MTHADARSRQPGLGWLFLGALLLRLVGVDWGGTYGDEHIWNSARALGGQLVFADHFYPPLIHYLNACAFALLYAAGRLLGIWHDTGELRAQYFADPTPFYLAARTLTACFSAAAAPLAALAARRLRLDPRGALLVGLLVALLPVSVRWAHVMKPMVGMSTAVLLTLWLSLVLLDRPRGRALAAGVGAAAATALAFKHSALFSLLPLLVGLPLLLRREGQPWGRVARLAGLAIAAGCVTWPLLSLGIVLDIHNFLEFQKIQYQMSSRPFGLEELGATLRLLIDRHEGLGPPLALGALALPLVRRDARARWLWGACALGLAWVAWIAGERIFSGLFLPFTLVLAFLGGVTLVDGARSGGPRQRRLAGAGLVLALGWNAGGSLEVARQAVARPLADRLRAVLEAEARPDGDGRGTRILASYPGLCGVDVSAAAREAELARHRTLARKYGVELPPRGRDAAAPATSGPAYHLRGMPFTFYGMEDVGDDELQVVKPYVWPLQPEEWRLDHWRAQGVELVLLWELTTMSAHPVAGGLYRELLDPSQATVLTRLPCERPLFFELPVTILRVHPRDER